jgi:Zn-finger nucleic acid-binding protein
MTMSCPRCRSALKAEKHDTGIAWRCKGCGGQSLNFSQFRKLVPEPKANGIWEEAMLHPLAPRRRTLCPECQRDMAAVLIPMKDRELELEVCRNCQRLWLDSQENIAGHLTAGAAPGPQPEAWTISASARERLAEALARGTRRRFSGETSITTRLVLIALFILYGIVRLWLEKR